MYSRGIETAGLEFDMGTVPCGSAINAKMLAKSSPTPERQRQEHRGALRGGQLPVRQSWSL